VPQSRAFLPWRLSNAGPVVRVSIALMGRHPKPVTMDEIATAIARCAGALAESGRAEPYGSSSKIFFEC